MPLPRAGMLKIGAFAADAESRTRFAAGFFDKATADSVFGAGSVGTDKVVVVGNLDLAGHIFTNSGAPSNPSDLATKAYVDLSVPNVATLIHRDGSVAFTADQGLGGHKITNSAAPTNPGDLATKAYVDANAGGGGNLNTTYHFNNNHTVTVDTGRILLTKDDGDLEPALEVHVTQLGGYSAPSAVFTGSPPSAPDSVASERFGAGSSALGFQSVAIGFNATAGALNDSFLTAVGFGTAASGQSSEAFGAGANAQGRQTTAIGSDSFIGPGAVHGYALGGQVTNEGTLQNYDFVILGRGATPPVAQQQAFSLPTYGSAVLIGGSSENPLTDVFFGSGVLASNPLAVTIHGTQGQTDSAMSNPGQLPTAARWIGAGTFTAGTWRVRYTYTNGIGETLPSPIRSVVLQNNDGITLTANRSNPRATAVNFYVEDAPGSGNFLFVGRAKGTTGNFDTTIQIDTPPTTSAPAPVSNTTAYTGNGGNLNLAGGLGETNVKIGGNVGFYTARTATATTLTLAGFFNGSDGTFSVPGSGSTSERFGLNARADQPASIAIGNGAQAGAGYLSTGSVVIGAGATVTSTGGFDPDGGVVFIGEAASSNAFSGSSGFVVIGSGAGMNGSGTFGAGILIGRGAQGLGGCVIVGAGGYSLDRDSTIVGQASYSTAMNAVGLGKAVSITGTDSIGVGRSATIAPANCVGIGSNVSIDAGSGNAVIIGHGASATGAAGSVVVGDGAFTTAGQGIAIGQFALANVQYGISIGWEANTFGTTSIGIGGRAHTWTQDRITHITTPKNRSFVTGHMGWEVNDFYIGGGIQAPETSGRFAQSPPHGTIHGTGGQTWTTISEPFNEAFNGSAFTASSVNDPDGQLNPGDTYLVAIGFTNKERNGETLLTTPFAVTINGGDNSIIVQNLAAAIAADPQIEEALVYMESPAGSGNLYLQGASIGADVALNQPPSIFSVPGYLGYPAGGEVVTGGQVTTPDASAQITANTTASNGHGWKLALAGGDSDDAALPGGNIEFLTNRTGVAHTLTLGGFFNAADGTFSVPGTGARSERFGLNTQANGADTLAIGTGAVAAFDCSIAVGVQFSGQAATARGVSSGPGVFPTIAMGLGAQAGPLPAAVIVAGKRISDCIAIGDGVQAGIGSGNQADCIAIGDGSVAGGNNASDTNSYFDCIAIGDGSVAGANGGAYNTSDAIAIGDGSSAQGLHDCIAIGDGATAGSFATDHDNIAIGDGPEATGTYGISIGDIGIHDAGAHDYVILGHGTSVTGALANSFICGAPGHAITDVWFGTGPSSMTGAGAVVDYTLHGSDGRLSQVNGGRVNIAAGRGLGAGNQGGSVHIQVALDGAATTLVDAFFVDRNGNNVAGLGTLTGGGGGSTDGFLHIPRVSSAPTVTPTTFSGHVALAYNTGDSKLYLYDTNSSSWKASGAFA